MLLRSKHRTHELAAAVVFAGLVVCRGCIRSGYLPLLAGTGETQAAFACFELLKHIAVFLCDDDGDADDAAESEEQVEAVEEDWLAFEFQKLFGSVGLHSGTNAASK